MNSFIEDADVGAAELQLISLEKWLNVLNGVCREIDCDSYKNPTFLNKIYISPVDDGTLFKPVCVEENDNVELGHYHDKASSKEVLLLNIYPLAEKVQTLRRYLKDMKRKETYDLDHFDSKIPLDILF